MFFTFYSSRYLCHARHPNHYLFTLGFLRLTDKTNKVNDGSWAMPPTYKTRGSLKSASFHGRIPSLTNSEHRQMMRRPTTQPDLLRNTKSPPPSSSSSSSSTQILSKSRVPAKVPVNVTVRSSLWAVQVMASTEWKVEDLITASLRQYVKEGRKPLLPPSSIDSSVYTLHHSQYSLQSLHPGDKLVELGSRNFFLCPKTVLHEADDASAEEEEAISTQLLSDTATKTPVTHKSWIFSWVKFIAFD